MAESRQALARTLHAEAKALDLDVAEVLVEATPPTLDGACLEVSTNTQQRIVTVAASEAHFQLPTEDQRVQRLHELVHVLLSEIDTVLDRALSRLAPDLREVLSEDYVEANERVAYRLAPILARALR